MSENAVNSTCQNEFRTGYEAVQCFTFSDGIFFRFLQCTFPKVYYNPFPLAFRGVFFPLLLDLNLNLVFSLSSCVLQ